MKKYIKNLTKADMETICDKQNNCIKCPLFLGISGRIQGCIKVDAVIFKTALRKANRKIEIKKDRSE